MRAVRREHPVRTSDLSRLKLRSRPDMPTIINKYAKHRARLCKRYILSDEGQINLAKGYATPIREDVELPEDVASKLLDDSQYVNARMVEDQDAWDETATTIGTLWQEEVVAYAQYQMTGQPGCCMNAAARFT